MKTLFLIGRGIGGLNDGRKVGRKESKKKGRKEGRKEGRKGGILKKEGQQKRKNNITGV